MRLLDDRPPRTVNAPVRPRVLLVHGAFLARRGETLTDVLAEFSEPVWVALLAKYPEHTVVVVVPPELDWLVPTLEERKARFVVIDYANVLDTSTRMRALLGESGVRLRTGTERLATHLNVDRYVVDGEITRVGPDEYDAHGIEPDKELTVKEMCVQRQATSKWTW